MASSSRRASSARWLLSKPPKLEATKRHSVGHPHLRSPWPTPGYFVTHPDSLSCDSPPTLLDKLVPRRSSSNPVLARWGEAGGTPGSTARHRPEAPCPYPGGLAPPGEKRAGAAAPPLLMGSKQSSELRATWDMGHGVLPTHLQEHAQFPVEGGGWLGRRESHCFPTTWRGSNFACSPKKMNPGTQRTSSAMTRMWSAAHRRRCALSPSTGLCSPFDARILRCNNRTTPGAGPSKAPQKPKNTLKTPLEPAKKRWSRTPHLCSPNWSGGAVSAQVGG
jgi:hypothetical protein